MNTQNKFTFTLSENATPAFTTTGVTYSIGSTPIIAHTLLPNQEEISGLAWNRLASFTIAPKNLFYLGSEQQFVIVPAKHGTVSFTIPAATSSNPASSPQTISLGSKGASTNDIINDLVALLRERGSDDEGFPLAPTTDSFDAAWRLLATTAGMRSSKLPIGHILTDKSGGIRIEWENGDRHLRLNIAPSSDQLSYIYLQQGGIPRPKYYILWDCSPEQLARRLDWLEFGDVSGVGRNGEEANAGR